MPRQYTAWSEWKWSEPHQNFYRARQLGDHPAEGYEYEWEEGARGVEPTQEARDRARSFSEPVSIDTFELNNSFNNALRLEDATPVHVSSQQAEDLETSWPVFLEKIHKAYFVHFVTEPGVDWSGKVPALLDTGATWNFIRKDQLFALGFDYRHIDTRTRVTYSDANGIRKQAEGTIKLRHYSQASLCVYHATFHVAETLQRPIILGLRSSLEEFNAIMTNASAQATGELWYTYKKILEDEIEVNLPDVEILLHIDDHKQGTGVAQHAAQTGQNDQTARDNARERMRRDDEIRRLKKAHQSYWDWREQRWCDFNPNTGQYYWRP